MNYLFYALIAYGFWAISIVIDKILRSKYIKHSVVLSIFFVVMNFIPFLFMMPFINIVIPEFRTLIISLAAGSLMTLAIIPYFKSLSFDEASRVAPLWHISPVFVLVMALIFLGEKLSVSNYIGFCFLLFGGLFISTRKIKDIFKLKKTFILMISACFIMAIRDILVKYIYNSLDYWNGIFWVLLGAALASILLLLLKKNRVDLKSTIVSLKKKSILLLLIGLFGGFFGRIFFFKAIKLGQVSIVTVLGGFESLFVLLYAILLSKYLPKLFKEEIGKKIILHKITAIFLMFVGLVFIYI